MHVVLPKYYTEEWGNTLVATLQVRREKGEDGVSC